MYNTNNNSNITPESVLETLDAALKKFAAEVAERAAEFEQRLEKSRAEAEKENKALRESIRLANRQITGKGDNNVAFAQEFFYNSP